MWVGVRLCPLGGSGLWVWGGFRGFASADRGGGLSVFGRFGRSVGARRLPGGLAGWSGFGRVWLGVPVPVAARGSFLRACVCAGPGACGRGSASDGGCGVAFGVGWGSLGVVCGLALVVDLVWVWGQGGGLGVVVGGCACCLGVVVGCGFGVPSGAVAGALFVLVPGSGGERVVLLGERRLVVGGLFLVVFAGLVAPVGAVPVPGVVVRVLGLWRRWHVGVVGAVIVFGAVMRYWLFGLLVGFSVRVDWCCCRVCFWRDGVGSGLFLVPSLSFPLGRSLCLMALLLACLAVGGLLRFLCLASSVSPLLWVVRLGSFAWPRAFLCFWSAWELAVSLGFLCLRLLSCWGDSLLGAFWGVGLLGVVGFFVFVCWRFWRLGLLWGF
ncbi:hypothetical protein SAMN02927923_03442 [Microvirga guangxiensis]|uniref:Uncharacterized protein n=1 Tax=Microvirga guangxiensis TaxID=549386 RepID=A0A1G5KND1_9HYPH|nr:hypothetical protein SAMN02927923_03442 [Microvirga guangxiensis]